MENASRNFYKHAQEDTECVWKGKLNNKMINRVNSNLKGKRP